MNKYKEMMGKLPKIKFCPSCKCPIEKNKHYTESNGFSCPNCEIDWNIQYLTFGINIELKQES